MNPKAQFNHEIKLEVEYAVYPDDMDQSEYDGIELLNIYFYGQKIPHPAVDEFINDYGEQNIMDICLFDWKENKDLAKEMQDVDRFIYKGGA